MQSILKVLTLKNPSFSKRGKVETTFCRNSKISLSTAFSLEEEHGVVNRGNSNNMNAGYRNIIVFNGNDVESLI